MNLVLYSPTANIFTIELVSRILIPSSASLPATSDPPVARAAVLALLNWYGGNANHNNIFLLAGEVHQDVHSIAQDQRRDSMPLSEFAV